jgi:hypothetical protein
VRDHPAVHVQHRQRLERIAVALRRPVLARDAPVLEGDPGDVQREARGLAAAAVKKWK